MSGIKVGFLGSIEAPKIYENSKVISKGDKCNRVELNPSKGIQISIAMASQKVFKSPPMPICIEKFFGRRYVNLQVSSGENQGFIKVNAESLRKRLGISKEEFKKIVDNSTNLDVTAEVNKVIFGLKSTTKTQLEFLKEEVFERFNNKTDLSQLESAKIYFGASSDRSWHAEDEDRAKSFKKEFTLNGRANNEQDENIQSFFLKQLDYMFASLAAEKINHGPKPIIQYVVVCKQYDGNYSYFSRDSYTSNAKPSGINDLFSKFAGKMILVDNQEGPGHIWS